MSYRLETKTGNLPWHRSAYCMGEMSKELADLRMSYAKQNHVDREYRLAWNEEVPKPAADKPGPTHYTALKPEPIDVIEGWGYATNFYRANAIKYVARAGRKDSSTDGTIKDLTKAISYLQREINALRGKPAW